MSEFNLSVISLAAAADANALAAFEDLHVEMLTWNAAGEYPAIADVIKALQEGYAQQARVVASTDTLKQYASGIIKWSKAGKVPSVYAMRAFMQPVPGSKSAKGRKPGQGKGKTTKPAEAEAPKVAAESRVDMREGAMVALQGMMAAKVKLASPAMLADFENAILAALAILRASKPE